MKAASVFIAAAALAIAACGFVKMAQNSVVENHTASFIARTRPATPATTSSLLGANPMDFTNVKGAKAIIKAWVQANQLNLDQSIVTQFKASTIFGSKSEKNRAITLPKDTIEKSLPLMLTLSVTVLPSAEEQKEMINTLRKCEKGGVIFNFANSPSDYVKNDGFEVSMNFIAIDCKAQNMEIIGFGRVMGGSFRPVEIKRKVLVCSKEGWFSVDYQCKKVQKSIKVPVQVDDELKSKTIKAINYLLIEELKAVSN